MKIWGWLLTCCMFAGCAAVPSKSPVANQHTYVDADSNFHLTWGDHFTRLDDPPRDNPLRRRWRLDATNKEPGTLVAVWRLAGSNDVTSAALRYGVSRHKASLKHCLRPGGGWENLPANQVMIGGRPFTHFHLQDGGMSHYMTAEAYRSRYQGRCYAIDLVVRGTNPKIYSPPRKPPFRIQAARASLHRLLLRVEWLAPG